MRILGIETSCDETAAAVVEDGRRILSSIVASSRTTFERSGGVIPEEAARQQIPAILPVITQALEDAKVKPEELDSIAVTYGPGLMGSLLVGVTTARVLSRAWRVPLIPVHHTLGHLSSVWLLPPDMTDEGEAPTFPVLTLSASGGHTELWLRHSHIDGVLLGRTRDDAAGEAFDKGASLLGLPYPGGPAIERAAKEGNPNAHAFPLPLHRELNCDFSFAGLKTALRYLLRDKLITPPIDEETLRDVAASYQHALAAHLAERLHNAIVLHPEIREVHLVGGVAANATVRALAERACGDRIIRAPLKLSLCTDNAAMIAAAGAFLRTSRDVDTSGRFTTTASLPLEAALGAESDIG